LPNWSRSSAKNSADFGSACTGLKGSSRPRSFAVPGMKLRNPLRPLAAARHRPDRVGAEAALLPDHAGEEFERQVEAFAADSIIRHIASRASLSRAPSAAIARGWKLDRVASPASSAKALAKEDKSTRRTPRREEAGLWHGRLQSGCANG
jgi:hypothetical protein